jgi:hypothetical protein
MPASEIRHGIPSADDSRGPGRENVRRDARSAGVAADGSHRSVLAVFPGSLSHAARPNRLHEESVAGPRSEVML